MTFDSLLYLGFLWFVVVLHRILPHQMRWVLLLAASVVFYAVGSVPLSLLLLGVIALTYAAGLLLGAASTQRQKRAILIAAIAACVGLLLYFKYFRFLAERAQALVRMLGGQAEWNLWDVVLPVGVSFYTFQAMAYVIDVYRGTLPPERHFGYYALFISFFPQLVAGPIERAENLLPQLKAERAVSREDMRVGIRLLLSGLFRKVVLADFCGSVVDRVYASSAPDGSAVAVATLLFAVQIYCDFAGYSEIARGSARLVGIRLMPNFDRPYLAENIREFWRRWHISLSKWLTDYVYIPLGGSQKGLARQIAATIVVFLISGLWHGANDTFVVWGLLHGAWMIACLLLRRVGRAPGRVGKIGSTVLTFFGVTLLWIFFRAQSLAQAWDLIGRLFSPWNVADGLALMELTGMDAARFALALGVSPLLWQLTDEKRRETDLVYVFLILAIALAWVIRLDTDTVSAFLYFQF